MSLRTAAVLRSVDQFHPSAQEPELQHTFGRRLQLSKGHESIKRLFFSRARTDSLVVGEQDCGEVRRVLTVARSPGACHFLRRARGLAGVFHVGVPTLRREFLGQTDLVMDPITFYFLANMLVLILEQEGYSLSVVSDSAASDEASPAEPGGGRAARREKRCSCENLKDRECVYFCHIGIVWVNTPRQVVPYGVGSLPVRLRRDVGKCVCTDNSDSGCLQFCKASHVLKKQVGITTFQRMLPSKSREKYEWNLSEMERKRSLHTKDLKKS
ncbi:uncharacterized protein si:ch211-202p1.5 [Anguilla rostrata]|uniref:uncharacterized protein si:ch211-202p1.5 n=1 Tax=Anguilla rostrata TaxID=7938 RepID=UPI0030D20595